MYQFSLSQLVKKPTRGNNILDVFLTRTPFDFSTVKCVDSLINTDHKSIIVNSRTTAKATGGSQWEGGVPLKVDG